MVKDTFNRAGEYGKRQREHVRNRHPGNRRLRTRWDSLAQRQASTSIIGESSARVRQRAKHAQLHLEADPRRRLWHAGGEAVWQTPEALGASMCVGQGGAAIQEPHLQGLTGASCTVLQAWSRLSERPAAAFPNWAVSGLSEKSTVARTAPLTHDSAA